MMQTTDPFTVWFLERVKAVHGVDLTAMTGSPSQLVLDSNRAVGEAK